MGKLAIPELFTALWFGAIVAAIKVCADSATGWFVERLNRKGKR